MINYTISKSFCQIHTQSDIGVKNVVEASADVAVEAAYSGVDVILRKVFCSECVTAKVFRAFAYAEAGTTGDNGRQKVVF